MKAIPTYGHSRYYGHCYGCQDQLEMMPDGTIPDYCPSCRALRERDK